MKHHLDYRILKGWGFVWASKDDDGNVTSYHAPEYHFGDHILGDVTLMIAPDLAHIPKWYIQSEYMKLFAGLIADKEALKVILRATLIFKPGENQ